MKYVLLCIAIGRIPCQYAMTDYNAPNLLALYHPGRKFDYIKGWRCDQGEIETSANRDVVLQIKIQSLTRNPKFSQVVKKTPLVHPKQALFFEPILATPFVIVRSLFSHSPWPTNGSTPHRMDQLLCSPIHPLRHDMRRKDSMNQT